MLSTQPALMLSTQPALMLSTQPALMLSTPERVLLLKESRTKLVAGMDWLGRASTDSNEKRVRMPYLRVGAECPVKEPMEHVSLFNLPIRKSWSIRMNVAQLIRELLMVRDQETPVYIGIRGEDGNQDYVPVTHAGGMFMVLEEENKTSLVIALS